ncbi:DUF4327 family protein [Aphanothece sacrum]|uniref:DUF4327 domain-containing protein n=1 Tax=Aphanothece sacrum FPU1 TaxID=1920663 RepID=A0A401IHW4_APHSA|nr:DUF4327 family protein [Aphanothece sacrum]GBF80721.1 hypothetical protein AsFPU1_2125 [Aphanothece sacrum FPU1]GBF83215.1 hypothetical protein AsFPU3_0254 [Aphanothece sacrum FPU3]
MLNMIESRVKYSVDVIREEAYQLVCEGKLHRQQSIYNLCKYIPPCEWPNVECELERHDFLLRDPIIDLLSGKSWIDD